MASNDPGLAAPRLLALRVQGFKSFAERTSVEFGAGISAVVGPNGSGKSNLADALRWALGEQGRALRSRKAEDVIWAGSEKRSAQGMADVTLVLDNADGLLPVDFQVLELGRRLFRSGENEYLLNKQRIRLRDLVDLLDAAHLADNAFLFIGQGMVDQALALRPEERRPLFEEVAGVRRHERRRRKAEEQLVESEANLARVEDILAELRPQARRLAAQAEQQATRSSVGEELAAALLASTQARWHESAARLRHATARRAEVDAAARDATRELSAAEADARQLAAELATRADVERERRAAHDAARAALSALQVRDGRSDSELEAIERDRRRLTDERAAAEAELAVQHRSIAVSVPPRDVDLESAVSEADRELADALAELATLRAATRAQDEDLGALRRAEAARTAELETARRRVHEAERRAAEQRAASEGTAARLSEATERSAAADRALEFAIGAERSATVGREAAETAADVATAERAAVAERAEAAVAATSALRARVEALAAQLEDEERRPIAGAARRRGGRRLDEDLVVEPELRAAVAAALAERARAYLVASVRVPELATERGRLLVEERFGGPEPSVDGAARRFLDAVANAGGGRLDEAVRRDGAGAARRLLARAVWLPDLASCLELQGSLPPGWVAVSRDGASVVDETGVILGAVESSLDRRAEHARLAADLERAEAAAGKLRSSAAQAAMAADDARRSLEAARADETRRAGERRQAEVTQRSAATEAEAAAREAAWHEAQGARLDGEVTRLTEALTTMKPDSGPSEPDAAGAGREGPGGNAIGTWEARAAELRERRDRLAARLNDHDATRRDAEHARARAEAATALAQDRLGRADREVATLAQRESTLQEERDGLRREVATAVTVERDAREALSALLDADAADRSRLADAERAASAARERLRLADERVRAADHAELEARLGLEGLRESVLVELAGMGQLGWSTLGVVDPAEDEPAVLEAALTTAGEHWATEPPPSEVPSIGRLATLRRRYHELGAANPFAVEEYAELKARLDGLETQGADLLEAIGKTRDLIAELDGLIADQFRTTFAALEAAFERRFEQLFGGGFARLSLTDPSDLGTTGIEIVARPPGKKPQALAMLSGGERALTAVALLFAMLEVRPVPFCVLDEVDAALDEANIGRFAEALRGLADRTQFVVITHNRGTIEAADALYGVTVGDDSVSRVISLRLDEAQALASERRGELSSVG